RAPRFRRPVAGHPCVEPGPNGLLALRDGDGMTLFDRAERGPARALRIALPLRLVEEHRRLRELIEDEQERAEQEDQELHRNLQQGVEDQPEAAFAYGGSADVALHLRLVGPEIRKREEESAEQTRP